MSAERRSKPMPVKYWSFAGLVLTYWCNARCASCYFGCGPAGGEEMDVDAALALWASLISASPHGCRIHISGGEPFGNWPRLIELCRRAKADGLGPLEKVETNAMWAAGERIVRDRLTALDEAGMRKLVISADPYHQEFVPIERCRLAARLGEQLLGADRVQVRWRDWLAEGFDTDQLSPPQRDDLFARYAAKGRDRLNGRAARGLARYLPAEPVRALADNPCRQALLRSRHVHVDGGGRVMPGVCAGIVLGLAGRESIAEIWSRLNHDHAARPIVGTLAEQGPVGLLARARQTGYAVKPGYSGKCHLCWELRRHLAGQGLSREELGPAGLYESA